MPHEFSRLTLTDTGPIVAMLDPREQNHDRCWAAMRSLPETGLRCAQIGVLMETYSDVPMDFADGALVLAAEDLKVDTIFTLDRHFYAYRRSNGNPFTVIPD